jgi:hypothetical protein
VVANTCAPPPDVYNATFSGFSVFGDTWSGEATFNRRNAATSSCDSGDPPTSQQLQYCYDLVNGTAQWQYQSSALTVNLAPATDFGLVTLRVKDSRPDFVRTYHALLSPELGGHCMPVTNPCRDASNSVLAWIQTAVSNPSAVWRIGDGWQLSGSVTLCAPEDPSACQGWRWDFQPTWNAPT